MRRRRATPEHLLQKAMLSRSIAARARYANLGLAAPSVDRTTQAMLLRQLYLCAFEQRHFGKALQLALQAVELDVLPDVILEDAARAALAEGDLEGALLHLKAAVRRAPATRRAFHQWTLGSTLFIAHRYREAVEALTRAGRGKGDRTLYRAHLTLARIAGGFPVTGVREVIAGLAGSPAGRGYGRFVLGHLLYAAGEWKAAERCLRAFVERLQGGRPAVAIALEGELRMSRATLVKMDSVS